MLGRHKNCFTDKSGKRIDVQKELKALLLATSYATVRNEGVHRSERFDKREFSIWLSKGKEATADRNDFKTASRRNWHVAPHFSMV